MIIPRPYKGLLKRGILRVYREIPEAVGWPVFYMGISDRGLRETALAVKTIQSLEALPWPDTKCVVVAEDILAPFRGQRALWFLVQRNIWAKPDDVPDGHGYETADIYRFYTDGTVEREWGPVRHAFIKGTYDHLNITQSEFDARGVKDMCGSAHYQALPQAIQEFVRECRPTLQSGVWSIGYDLLTGKKFRGKDGRELDQAGAPAWELLTAFANIATPCGYRVWLRNENGFGNKAQRKLTGRKPILADVRYDRIYRTCEALGMIKEKRPHPRSGHLRFLWAKAGVDRRTLPDDPGERLRIRARRNVQPVYVRACWVGPDDWYDDGTYYEIDWGPRPPLMPDEKRRKRHD